MRLPFQMLCHMRTHKGCLCYKIRWTDKMIDKIIALIDPSKHRELTFDPSTGELFLHWNTITLSGKRFSVAGASPTVSLSETLEKIKNKTFYHAV